jgi:hypothetical protein
MNKGYTIDCEAADLICLAVLKDHRDYLQSELKSHLETGSYMHPEDLVKNKKLVKKMTYLIDNYFGG